MKHYLSAWQMLPRMQVALLAVLAIGVVLANIAQPYPDIAPLHHIPTVLLILAAPLLLRRYPLSDGAVMAVTAFFLLHTLGARYTYSNVPYDAWAVTLFGQDIGHVLKTERNGFDRLVHLCFGLFWTLPLAEIARRYGGMGRAGALWMAFLFIGAASAAYEVFEWGLTLFVAADMAEGYNGQQGDMWDSQKDSALAMLGSALACLWAVIRSRSRG